MEAKFQKIIEMVKKGVPDDEMMRELGIKSKVGLHRAYYNALVEAGKIKNIVTRKSLEKRMAREKILAVSERETILLGRLLVAGRFGFKKGDKFRVSKRSNNIILRKTED